MEFDVTFIKIVVPFPSIGLWWLNKMEYVVPIDGRMLRDVISLLANSDSSKKAGPATMINFFW